MKELTVIELSEETGLTRSQIYHLNKKHNFINLNKKINYEDALPIITALTIKKAKKANEKVDEKVVYAVVKAILENFDEFKKQHPAYSNITKESLLEGISTPLHEGAKKYFEEIGLLKN